MQVGCLPFPTKLPGKCRSNIFLHLMLKNSNVFDEKNKQFSWAENLVKREKLIALNKTELPGGGGEAEAKCDQSPVSWHPPQWDEMCEFHNKSPPLGRGEEDQAPGRAWRHGMPITNTPPAQGCKWFRAEASWITFILLFNLSSPGTVPGKKVIWFKLFTYWSLV